MLGLTEMKVYDSARKIFPEMDRAQVNNKTPAFHLERSESSSSQNDCSLDEEGHLEEVE